MEWQYYLLVWICLCMANTTQEATIYISPSPSTPCHHALPCLTLSQFAANSTVNDLNITLIFLPGNHSLDVAMSVKNTTKLKMLSSSSTLPFVTCQQNANFTLIKIGQVLIQNLKFVGCGDGKVANIRNFTIDSSTFQGHDGTKTALVIEETNVMITNSSFVSYTEGSYRGPLNILPDQTTNKTETHTHVGGAIIATDSNIIITTSSFERNHAEIGGAIFCEMGTNITIINTIFVGNGRCDSESCFGGAIYCQNDFKPTGTLKAQITILHSNFSGNNATHGGVLATYTNVSVTIRSSTFYNNKWVQDPTQWYSRGGIFHFSGHTNVSIDGCQFYNNGGNYTQGGVLNIEFSRVAIHNSNFCSNRVRSFGGVISMLQAAVMIDTCHFYNNSAYQGGVLVANQHCSITVDNSTFIGNSVTKVDENDTNACGGVMIITLFVNFTANRILFRNNKATKHGGVFFANIARITFDSCCFIENQANEDGGVMYLTWSDITFFGLCSIMGNFATRNGGTIFASSNSILNVYDRLDVMNNTANDSGGGFYLFHSTMINQFNSTVTFMDNRAIENGGGIYATISVLIVLSDRDSPMETSVHFTNNTSKMGGGIYLALTSQLYVIKSGNNYTRTIYNLYFTANSANYGGALYVADETNSEQCASVSYTNLSVDTECFLQVISPISIDQEIYNYISVTFSQNVATISGSTLYGGLLDRCTLDPKAEISFSNRLTNHSDMVDGFTFLMDISDIDDSESYTISSKPVDIHFCKPPLTKVMKGQIFSVSVVAVDQINQTLSNIPIYASLRYSGSRLGEGQMVQTTTESCTSLNFSIYSKNLIEDLILYAEGPCKNTSKSRKTIKITFLNCKCPIGFQPNQLKKSSCSCKCDPKLQKYVTNCNSSTHTIERDGNFWITYIIRNTSDPNEGGDYLIYPYCPFDYCVRPHSKKIEINLNNTINGSDAQCANSRSGLLCGVCQPGFSLSLGSSRCIPCSKQWHRNSALLVGAALLAGIGLVALIFILNLTVAKGTLNGLIFYANIIGADESTFFPSSPAYLNRLPYVFLSWLNLDLGFDICFFKGMDTYWKTWIQLAFPTYVISLVVLITVVSERSLLFSKLIAGKNPIAALSTLIMLSYAKILRTIITALSLATLNFYDGPKRMWLADATVEYFSGKHIVLFIVAILILLAGIVYTCLLFFWQWLLRFITYPRLCHLFEVYHVPYIIKHRYWTGLLLVVRVFLYLVFAFNTSRDPGVSLTAIIAVTGGLLFLLKGHFGRIYKNWTIDLLETTCYLNITLLSATTLFLYESNRDPTAVTFVSVFITFTLCLIVIVYHVYAELLLKLWIRIKGRNDDLNRDSEVRSVLDNIGDNDIEAHAKPTCTHSEIEAPRHTSECLEAVNDSGQESCDDSECTPLMNKYTEKL